MLIVAHIALHMLLWIARFMWSLFAVGWSRLIPLAQLQTAAPVPLHSCAQEDADELRGGRLKSACAYCGGIGPGGRCSGCGAPST